MHPGSYLLFSASKVIANTELDTAYICSSHCLTNYMCAEKISVPYDSVACTTTFSSSKLDYLFCQTLSVSHIIVDHLDLLFFTV